MSVKPERVRWASKTTRANDKDRDIYSDQI